MLRAVEWILTGLFSIEYCLRLLAAPRATRYVRSFFGVVDLLALLPTFLSLFIAGTHSLLVIRGLRLLRIFRVLKLALYVGEAGMLASALKGSARKILVFLEVVLTIQLIVGALMFLIEGEESGYAIIAVPTGIVASEMSVHRKTKVKTRHCENCVREGHDSDARFCKFCGGSLDPH